MRTSKPMILLIVALTGLFIIRSADAQTVINETFKNHAVKASELLAVVIRSKVNC